MKYLEHRNGGKFGPVILLRNGRPSFGDVHAVYAADETTLARFFASSCDPTDDYAWPMQADDEIAARFGDWQTSSFGPIVAIRTKEALRYDTRQAEAELNAPSGALVGRGR